MADPTPRPPGGGTRPRRSQMPPGGVPADRDAVRPGEGGPLLSLRGLRVPFPAGRRHRVEVLHGIDLDLAPGEVLGIVGESGSGKSTLGRAALRLVEPEGGRIIFDGREITHLAEAALRPLRPRMQMVFQAPMSSLNPRRTALGLVAAPLAARGEPGARARAAGALERVGLAGALHGRFPHQLSGGQRQRVGIARAVAQRPALILADEIASWLDVSSQARVLALQIAPKVAFAPLFIMWFGYNAMPKLLVTVLIVFFPILVNVLQSMKTVDRDLVNLARVCDMSRWAVFLKIELPSSMPALFAGLRIGATLAVIGVAVGELVGGNRGLGYLITFGEGVANTAMVFNAIALLTVIGIVLYAAVAWAEGRVLHYLDRG